MAIKFSSYFTGRNFLLIFFTVFLLYIVFKTLYRIIYSKYNTGFEANKEFINSENGSSSDDNNSSAKSADILFFYADWCPHCKQAKPEWSKFKAEYQNKLVSEYKLNLIDVNCTSELGESGQLIKTYDVEGFPTVKANSNGKIINFDAKVTKENLDLFVKKML